MDASKTVCYKEPANFLKKISASVKKITENWSLVKCYELWIGKLVSGPTLTLIFPLRTLKLISYETFVF